MTVVMTASPEAYFQKLPGSIVTPDIPSAALCFKTKYKPNTFTTVTQSPARLA